MAELSKLRYHCNITALEQHFFIRHLPSCLPEYLPAHKRRKIDGRVELYETDFRLSQLLPPHEGDVTITTNTTTTSGFPDSFPVVPASFDPPPSSGLDDPILDNHSFLPNPTTDFTDFLRSPSPETGLSPSALPDSSQIIPPSQPQLRLDSRPSSFHPHQAVSDSFPTSSSTSSGFPENSQNQDQIPPITQPPPPSFTSLPTSSYSHIHDYPPMTLSPSTAYFPGSGNTSSALPLRFGAALDGAPMISGSLSSSPTQSPSGEVEGAQVNERPSPPGSAGMNDTSIASATGNLDEKKASPDKIEQHRVTSGVGFSWGLSSMFGKRA